MNKWLLCLLCCLGIGMGQAQAQKHLVVTQQEAPTAFYPESGKACVELISPLENLNIVSTFGETCTRELNEDELWVYRFVFDLRDESKRTLYISAPGFIREELKLALSNKQKLYFTVFPPEENKLRFYPGMLIEYVYSGSAMYGGRLAFGKRVGIYFGYKTSLLEREGVDIEDVTSFYDVSRAEEKGYIRQSITGGFRLGVVRWMYLYLGGGYGEYGRLWENPSPVEGKQKFTSDYSKAPEAELGLALRMGNFSLSAGANALFGEKLMCDYSVSAGFYINFRKKNK